MKKKCYEMMDGMENATDVLMIAKRQTKVHQIYRMMYGTRTQVFNWSERACHLSYYYYYFFFFCRYYGKILIMERIVYFYKIEICLMVKGKF